MFVYPIVVHIPQKSLLFYRLEKSLCIVFIFFVARHHLGNIAWLTFIVPQKKKEQVSVLFFPKMIQGHAVDEYGTEPMDLVVDKELLDIKTTSSGAPIIHE